MGYAGDQVESHRHAVGLSDSGRRSIGRPFFFGARMDCPTVKVVSPISDENPHGYIVINESDLTDDHKIFSEASAKADEPAKRKYTKQTDK
jgi:hypothetical protein